jgi:hypothetical protein
METAWRRATGMIRAACPPDHAGSDARTHWLGIGGGILGKAGRLATLVVFAQEMEAGLTDAALVMFDKMLGGVFRRADRKRKENVLDRAKTLDASIRALIGMAKAMLVAKDSGADQATAVENALGWERLKTLVAKADKIAGGRATTIWPRSSIAIRRCAAWFRSCSARSCFVLGNPETRCSPRSTYCATFTVSPSFSPKCMAGRALPIDRSSADGSAARA